jgi:thioredoxin reductase
MTRLDERSTAGKPLPVREHARLLVIGAGPAGLSAALEAARRGVAVVLVDEHPVDHALMGLDVPYHFGQRMGGSTRNKARMIETIAAADARIAEAFEAGVDVRLGVAVWGLFSQQPGLRWLRGHVAGLSDGESSWFLSFDAAIVATGRRDVGLAFPGWELPGVMGVTAASTLLQRYDAFDGRALAILGSGVEATQFAKTALAAGREVVALIEPAETPRDPAGCAELARQGVPVLTPAMISRAVGGPDGVEHVVVRGLGSDAADACKLTCDTVILATGAAPVIELLDVAGAEIAFAPHRGGYVPRLDTDGRTSIPGLFAAGDCAGIIASKTVDAAIAAAEGTRAAAAACDELAGSSAKAWQPAPEAAPGPADEDVEVVRSAWVAASMAVADAETHLCQCEEVNLADLLGVRPPRYLAGQDGERKSHDLAALAADGQVSQDQIKRLTRAGMGPCQGRRCREQVGAVLARATATPLSRMPLPSHRAPVRPLPLSAFAEDQEPDLLAQNWEGWFGIASQWEPFWTLSDSPGSEDRP